MSTLPLNVSLLLETAEIYLARYQKGDIFAQSCPCCRTYLRWHEDIPCLFCPIYQDTRKPWCHGTPYEDVMQAMKDKDPNAFRAATAHEYTYLITLAHKLTSTP